MGSPPRYDPLWRIVDANVNRAMEGMRTVEDLVRFGCNDARRAATCRRLRHAIGTQAARLDPVGRARVASRDVRRDVGRKAPPRRRLSWRQLLGDNVHRVTEALRVIEECARVIKPRVAVHFQELRFSAYALEQRLVTVRHHRRSRARRARSSQRRSGGNRRRG